MNKLDKAKLDEYIVNDIIQSNSHPNYPISILNYTRKAQFERLWNEYTLLCRGLIVDDEYNIIGRSFTKFFNYDEHKAEEIPNLSFEAFEKMDGSLGILFHYDNNWHIATRGSFTSIQAVRAKSILTKYGLENLKKDHSYIFEIIYPENRIVVDYGDDEKLVLLGVIANDDGSEMSYDDIVTHLKNDAPTIELVKRYDGVNDLKAIQELNETNREGYIIRFSNGMRVKLKFDEYCRLHRIVTNVSTKDVWEFLKEEKDINELLERVPDEFDSWVKKTILELREKFSNIENIADKEYRKVLFQLGENPSKKEFASLALQTKYPSILFSMNNNKSYDRTIWDMIEPEWSKAFSSNG